MRQLGRALGAPRTIDVSCLGAVAVSSAFFDLRPTGRPGQDIAFTIGWSCALWLGHRYSGGLAGMISLAMIGPFVPTPLLAVWSAGFAAAVASATGALETPGAAERSARRLSACSFALLALHLSVGTFQGASAVVVGLATVPLVGSLWRSERRAIRLACKLSLAAAVLVCTIGGLGAVLTYRASMGEVSAIRAELAGAIDLAKNGDVDGARAGIASARDDLRRVDARLGGPLLWPVRNLPISAQNIAEVTEWSELALRTADSAIALGDRFDRMRSGFASSGRIDRQPFDLLRSETAALSVDVDELLGALDGDSSPWVAPSIPDELGDIVSRLQPMADGLNRAAAALDVAEPLLGIDRPRTYLVLFVTPSESRGGGGMPGNWAELRLTNGKVELVDEGRDADLNDLLTDEPVGWSTDAEEYLARYRMYRPTTSWQNVNMSPHFPLVGAFTADAYRAITGVEVDGVIRVDPAVMAAMVELSGPLVIDGLDEPLDTANTEAYLLRGQYDAFDSHGQRIDVLAAAMRTMVGQLAQPRLDRLAASARRLIDLANGRHLAVWLDPEHWDGGTPNPLDGRLRHDDRADVLLVSEHDLLPNKIGYYLHRSVSIEVEVDRAATSVSTLLKLTIANSAPTTGPTYVVGTGQSGLPPGTARQLLTIYTAQDVESVTVDGRPTPLTRMPEAGVESFSFEISIPPGGVAVVEARLVGNSGIVDGDYILELPAVPAPHPDAVSVRINHLRAGSDTDGSARPATDIEFSDGRSIVLTSQSTAPVVT